MKIIYNKCIFKRLNTIVSTQNQSTFTFNYESIQKKTQDYWTQQNHRRLYFKENMFSYKHSFAIQAKTHHELMMKTLPLVKSLPSNDIKRNCLSFYATLATNRTICRSLLHKRRRNTLTITDIIGTIVSPRKWGWKAELMTVRKHTITKLPYVNSERSLSKDSEREYWIYSGFCVAVRAGGRSLELSSGSVR